MKQVFETFGKSDNNLRSEFFKCDSKFSKDYNYDDVVRDLVKTYNFEILGEGGFGVILGEQNCVVKVIKDISRCPELEKERTIYSIIEANRSLLRFIGGKIPKFYIYDKLDTFCHFTIERIYSPLSGYGDIHSDINGEPYGHGFALDTLNQEYIFMDMDDEGNGKVITKNKTDIYLIDRHGSLIHFYVNHFDKQLNERLHQNQGLLTGQNNLERLFGIDMIRKFSYEIGQLLSFLIFDCGVVPFDIEVVIGSRSKYDRVVVPYIFDFNESRLVSDYNFLNPTGLYDLIAKSMYDKNGKNYFPNNNNPYYESFYNGFVTSRQTNQEEANYILNAYNSLFNKN